MNKAMTIDRVSAEFTRWRSQKQPNDSIPQYLWDYVRTIYAHYPRGLIGRRLRLSSSQLTAHGFPATPSTATKQPKPPKLTAPAFVSVPPVATASPPTSEAAACVEIHRPDGTKIVIQSVTTQQVATWLAQLAGLAPCSS